MPFCFISGRVGIVVDSLKEERRAKEWVSIGLHWVWILVLLSIIPTTKGRLVFYAAASIGEGILHVQLLLSHLAKPWTTLRELSSQKTWYRTQVECIINIVNPVWFDWFHGGLNFHVEHHLFPTMPRHNLRRAAPYIRKACEECGITYDERPFTTALIDSLKHLHRMSNLFPLKPDSATSKKSE